MAHHAASLWLFVMAGAATLAASFASCGESDGARLRRPPDDLSGAEHAAGQTDPGWGIHGVLRSDGGRYFTDGTGRAIYLTGSHTWNNFQEIGDKKPRPDFDYPAYLAFLKRSNHNFIRLWQWESPRADFPVSIDASPMPYVKSGGKFDLSRFNPDYFVRLRQRVDAAAANGIYVSVMLFEGWSTRTRESWSRHPLNPMNNTTRTGPTTGSDSTGHDLHTLDNGGAIAVQKAYVKHVIETLNSADNVLFEVGNEIGAYSTEWQYAMIRYIKTVEATMPKQHPVGMTFQWSPVESRRGTNKALFSSPADWISPGPDGDADYKLDPPEENRGKVIISDTDHLWGLGGDRDWVWRTFMRGLNPIYMDSYSDHADAGSAGHRPANQGARAAMGHTLRLARLVNLAALSPREELASTRFCLAAPGQEYLVYQPGTGPLSVNVMGEGLWYDWYDPFNDRLIGEAQLVTNTGWTAFTPPFVRPAVLWIHRKPPAH
jgi:uncharacterized protein DUF4038